MYLKVGDIILNEMRKEFVVTSIYVDIVDKDTIVVLTRERTHTKKSATTIMRGLETGIYTRLYND